MKNAVFPGVSVLVLRRFAGTRTPTRSRSFPDVVEYEYHLLELLSIERFGPRASRPQPAEDACETHANQYPTRLVLRCFVSPLESVDKGCDQVE